MEVVKTTEEYTVYKKRNNRYGVKGSNKKWINGEEKVKILVANDLIKVSVAAPAPAEEEAPAEEAAAEETAE